MQHMQANNALHTVAHIPITHDQTIMVAFVANARWTAQILREVLVRGLGFAPRQLITW